LCWMLSMLVYITVVMHVTPSGTIWRKYICDILTGHLSEWLIHYIVCCGHLVMLLCLGLMIWASSFCLVQAQAAGTEHS
jgi:hypothetical protein